MYSLELGVVVHTCNPGTQAEGLRGQSHSGLYTARLFLKKNLRKKNTKRNSPSGNVYTHIHHRVGKLRWASTKVYVLKSLQCMSFSCVKYCMHKSLEAFFSLVLRTEPGSSACLSESLPQNFFPMTHSDRSTRGKTVQLTDQKVFQGKAGDLDLRTMKVKVQKVTAQCMWSQRCMGGVGDTWRKRPGACQLFLFLSQWFTEDLSCSPSCKWSLAENREVTKSKEPVSTRSCAREQMNSFSCPETPPTSSLLPKPWPCSVITPMCQAAETNPDRIQQPLVLRSDLLDSSRRYIWGP